MRAPRLGCIMTPMILALSLTAMAQTIDRAEALWKAQDFTGANEAFKALVAANPKNAAYRMRWGDLFKARFNPG